MRYEMMFPDQIRRAIDENWPVVLPMGVLEYHGEHLAVGMDTLVVIKALEILEKQIAVKAGGAEMTCRIITISIMPAATRSIG